MYIDYCERLVLRGVLDRWGDRRGWYTPRKTELEVMDLESDEAQMGPSEIWLPFDLSDQVEIYSGNIIIFAGAKDAGKTAISLNTAYENRTNWNVHYFNSEMGSAELRKRLSMSDYTIGQWQEGITFYSRAHSFHDVIKPGTENLNIIDFFEIHDEYYKIGMDLKAIHDRLKGAVCIVNLQKKHPGIDVPPLGSWRALEVCRVCLSIDYQLVKIKIAKNWRDSRANPRDKTKIFKLIDGYKIIDRHGWTMDKAE